MTNKAQPVLMFTNSRACSSLVMRQLSKQSNMEPKKAGDVETGGGYFFFHMISDENIKPLFLDPENLSEVDFQKLYALGYQKGCEDMLEYKSRAEANGKIAWIKELTSVIMDPTLYQKYSSPVKTDDLPLPVHDKFVVPYGQPRTNVTIFSDEFLLSWRPVFLIRHPALCVESRFRVDFDLQNKDSDMESVLDRIRFLTGPMISKRIFDFYHSSGRFAVENLIVIDADDILENPTTHAMDKLCDTIGLNKAEILTTWSPQISETVQAAPDDFQYRMKSTIDSSSGIMPGITARGLNLDRKLKDWQTEFGESYGSRLGNLTKEMMPDYEYLLQFKI